MLYFRNQAGIQLILILRKSKNNYDFLFLKMWHSNLIEGSYIHFWFINKNANNSKPFVQSPKKRDLLDVWQSTN